MIQDARFALRLSDTVLHDSCCQQGFLCGTDLFGVGSFKMEQPTEEDGVNPNFYQFILKNSSDEVGHSNKLKTVLDVIKDF